MQTTGASLDAAVRTGPSGAARACPISAAEARTRSSRAKNPLGRGLNQHSSTREQAAEEASMTIMRMGHNATTDVSFGNTEAILTQIGEVMIEDTAEATVATEGVEDTTGMIEATETTGHHEDVEAMIVGAAAEATDTTGMMTEDVEAMIDVAAVMTTRIAMIGALHVMTTEDVEVINATTTEDAMTIRTERTDGSLLGDMTTEDHHATTGIAVMTCEICAETGMNALSEKTDGSVLTSDVLTGMICRGTRATKFEPDSRTREKCKHQPPESSLLGTRGICARNYRA